MIESLSCEWLSPYMWCSCAGHSLNNYTFCSYLLGLVIGVFLDTFPLTREILKRTWGSLCLITVISFRFEEKKWGVYRQKVGRYPLTLSYAVYHLRVLNSPLTSLGLKEEMVRRIKDESPNACLSLLPSPFPSPSRGAISPGGTVHSLILPGHMLPLLTPKPLRLPASLPWEKVYILSPRPWRGS